MEPKCSVYDEQIMSGKIDKSRMDSRQTVVGLLNDGTSKSSLTNLAGEFSSAGAYPGFATCTWTISPPGATNLTIQFRSFSLESDFDFLYVFDGLSSKGKLLAKLSGSKVPNPVTSTTGTVFVMLSSDEAGAGAGFAATYAADNALPEAQPVAEYNSHKCTRPVERDRISRSCQLCIAEAFAAMTV